MAKYTTNDGITKEVDLLNFKFGVMSESDDNEVSLDYRKSNSDYCDLEDIFDEKALKLENTYRYLYLGYEFNNGKIEIMKLSYEFNDTDGDCKDVEINVELTEEEESMFKKIILDWIIEENL